jgi:hypothetical protein
MILVGRTPFRASSRRNATRAAAVIDLGADTITFQGVTKSALHGSDFIFFGQLEVAAPSDDRIVRDLTEVKVSLLLTMS